jgi:hypothetical protein
MTPTTAISRISNEEYTGSRDYDEKEYAEGNERGFIHGLFSRTLSED